MGRLPLMLSDFFSTQTSMEARSLFRVKVHPEYAQVVDDVVRLLIIQCVVQAMFTMNSPEAFPFFSAVFLATILYIMLGVGMYWLVFRRVLMFV